MRMLAIWILALINIGGYFITHHGINLLAFVMLMGVIILADQGKGD